MRWARRLDRRLRDESQRLNVSRFFAAPVQKNPPAASRRELLKAVGLAGAGVGAGGAASGPALASSDGSDLPEHPGWSETITHSESGDVTNDDFGSGYGTDPSGETGDDAEQEYSVSTLHTLSYVDAAWEPVGSPVDGGGCWRHTFSLASLAIEQVNKYGGTWLLSDWDASTLQDNGVSVHVPSAPDYGDPDDVAVGARRDPNLFRFAHPETVVDAVEAEADATEATMEDVLATIRDVEEPDTDPWFVEEFREAAQAVGFSQPVEHYVHSTFETLFGLALTRLSDVEDAAGAGTTVSRLGIALDVLDALDALEEAVSPERPPRFDRGVSQRVRGFDTVDGAAGHFLLFDVYTHPGRPATVEVSSDYFGTEGGSAFSGSWRLSIPGGPAGPGAVSEPAERYTATAVRDDSIESREADA